MVFILIPPLMTPLKPVQKHAYLLQCSTDHRSSCSSYVCELVTVSPSTEQSELSNKEIRNHSICSYNYVYTVTQTIATVHSYVAMLDQRNLATASLFAPAYQSYIISLFPSVSGTRGPLVH